MNGNVGAVAITIAAVLLSMMAYVGATYVTYRSTPMPELHSKKEHKCLTPFEERFNGEPPSYGRQLSSC